MTTTPPPFDPELAAALAVMGDQAPTTLLPEWIPMARGLGDDGPFELPTNEVLSRDGAFEVEERSVPGPEGAPDISLIICRPTSVPGPRPVVYHTHGGGMVLGNSRMGMDLTMEWAEELGLVVVSVEYRLAPEHPHPAPVEDCYAGLLWTAENAKDIGADPDRIILAGGSAGGGLAAALALLARDRNGPRAIGQMLLYPMLDDRNDTPSAHQMAGLGIWDRTANDTGWTALLGEARGTADVSPYAAPTAPRTCPGCRRPSSTWARPRPSATRTSPTRPGSGRRAARPSCTCGRARSTASTDSPRRPRCPRTPGRPGCGGCTDCSVSDASLMGVQGDL